VLGPRPAGAPFTRNTAGAPAITIFDDITARGRAIALVVAASVAGTPAAAPACDVCAIYTATEQRVNRTGPWLGVAEQFSRMATLRLDGTKVTNPGERLNSSITQLIFGYNFTPEVGLQLNLPIISRTFRRLEEGTLVDGDETGPGDLSLLATLRPVSHVTEESVLRFSFFGGLELPSGNPDRLQEELAEDHVAAGGEPVALQHDRRIAQHVTPGTDHAHSPGGLSGIHGHDLALGTGSVDGLIGGQMFWSWRRLFVTAAGQYAIRTVGAFDYRYANDLTWEAGPGAFLLLRPDHTLSLQAVCSGETKGKDTLDGQKLDDTAITALYLGPGIRYTWGYSLLAALTADLPLVQNNTALQIVPDYRLRAALTWHF